MLTWLQGKAIDGYLLVGFCELNGWEVQLGCHISRKDDIITIFPFALGTRVTDRLQKELSKYRIQGCQCWVRLFSYHDIEFSV